MRGSLYHRLYANERKMNGIFVVVVNDVYIKSSIVSMASLVLLCDKKPN